MTIVLGYLVSITSPGSPYQTPNMTPNQSIAPKRMMSTMTSPLATASSLSRSSNNALTSEAFRSAHDGDTRIEVVKRRVEQPIAHRQQLRVRPFDRRQGVNR